MLLVLYLAVCATNFGLINLAPIVAIRTPLGVINGRDLLIGLLMALTAPLYLQRRSLLTKASPWFRPVEAAWVMVIVLITVEAYRSPAYTTTDRLVNVRLVQYCLLFFPSVALLTSSRRIRLVAIVGLLFAVIGTVLMVMQSLYGLQSRFDSPLYVVGGAGTNQYVGGIARVVLPISNWTAFVILMLTAITLVRFRWWIGGVNGFLLLTILLNFARSLWLGMLAALFIEGIILWRYCRIDVRTLQRMLSLPVAVVASLFVAPYLGLGGITSALATRVQEGWQFFQTGSGTYGTRLDDTAYALAVWHSSPWWGVGTTYIYDVGKFLDVGYAISLVSVGLFGSCILALLYLTSWMAGVTAVRVGIRQASSEPISVGLGVAALIVLLIVYQQWLSQYFLAVTGFASALAVICPVIYGYEADTDVGIEINARPLVADLFQKQTAIWEIARQEQVRAIQQNPGREP